MYKLGLKFKYILNLESELRIGWVRNSRAVRLQAQRKVVGIVTLSLQDISEQLVVVHPSVKTTLRDAKVLPSPKAMVLIADIVLDHGVKRVSINDVWTPPDMSVSSFTIIPTPDNATWDDVVEAVKAAGYGNMRIEDGKVKQAIERITNELQSDYRDAYYATFGHS